MKKMTSIPQAYLRKDRSWLGCRDDGSHRAEITSRARCPRTETRYLTVDGEGLLTLCLSKVTAVLA